MNIPVLETGISKQPKKMQNSQHQPETESVIRRNVKPLYCTETSEEVKEGQKEVTKEKELKKKEVKRRKRKRRT